MTRNNTAAPKTRYTKKNLAAVESPELTEAELARAKPFREVFPKLAASIRRGRGPNKSPTKKLVSLRLSAEVIDHFKAQGPGWQTRIDETLRQIATGRRKSA